MKITEHSDLKNKL